MVMLLSLEFLYRLGSMAAGVGVAFTWAGLAVLVNLYSGMSRVPVRLAMLEVDVF